MHLRLCRRLQCGCGRGCGTLPPPVVIRPSPPGCAIQGGGYGCVHGSRSEARLRPYRIDGFVSSQSLIRTECRSRREVFTPFGSTEDTLIGSATPLGVGSTSTFRRDRMYVRLRIRGAERKSVCRRGAESSIVHDLPPSIEALDAATPSSCLSAGCRIGCLQVPDRESGVRVRRAAPHALRRGASSKYQPTLVLHYPDEAFKGRQLPITSYHLAVIDVCPRASCGLRHMVSLVTSITRQIVHL